MDYLQYTVLGIKAFESLEEVLNLIINGLPSIQKGLKLLLLYSLKVLNLIINGLPSIHKR